MQQQGSVKLQTVASLAVIVLCLLTGVLVVRDLLPRRAGADASSPPVGARLNLPGVDWNASRRTIVLAISTRCHFCAESVPFYQHLSAEAAQKNVRLLAVLPQSTTESSAYLAKSGIHVDKVVTTFLPKIGIQGTPTLLVVGSDGKVIDGWVGKMPVKNEPEILATIFSD